MTLRTKTLAIVVGSLATFLIAVLLLFRFTVYRTFLQLEADISSGHTQRMRGIAQAEMQTLRLHAFHWLTRYADATAPVTFDDGDMMKRGFDFSAARLSLAAIVDERTNVVFAQSYDINGNAFTDRASRFHPWLTSLPAQAPAHVLRQGGEGFSIAGSEGVFIVAVQPFPSAPPAPRRWVLLARALPQSDVHVEGARSRFTVAVDPRHRDQAAHSQTPPLAPFTLSTALNETAPTGFDTISGHAWFSDLLSGDPLVMTIDMPRAVYALGFLHSVVLSSALVTMSILFICLVLWLLNRHVLSRLTSSIRHLRGGLLGLAAEADLGRSLDIPDNDEFAALAQGINDLLSALRAAQTVSRDRARQLAQSEKLAALGTLVSGVAHEISTPNNYINLNAEMLERHICQIIPLLDSLAETQGDFRLGRQPYSEIRQKLPEMAADIRSGGRSIERIVRDLKSFSQQDEAAVPERVRINACLENAVRMLRADIDAATNAFSLQLDAANPSVLGNRQKLEQVFSNMIQNACQALTSNQQAVTVSSAFDAAARKVHVTIRDEGVGIREVDQKRILEPFYTTKRDRKGTGLGLFVSSAILEKHKATLKIESQVGKGACFTISFDALYPMTEAAPTRP